MKKVLTTLRKMLTENIILKLGSIVFAFLVWLAVVNVSDPNITRTITMIPIELTDTDTLSEQNMVYKFDSNQTAQIVISGKRSIISKLTKNDFSATAPLSEMSQVYAVPVYVELKNTVYQNYVTINQKTNTVNIEVEDLITKTYDVEIKFEGEPFTDYVVGKTSLGRTSVDITAPSSKHNLISKVAVDVDITDITASISRRYDIKLYKADGEEIAIDNEIELSAKRTRVNVDILYTKEIPINYTLLGEPANGYSITDIETSATTALICGKKELVDECQIIVIDGEELNITGITEDFEKSVDLEDYLPEGVDIYDSSKRMFKVSVDVESMVIKSYDLDIDNISLTNIPSKYKAVVISDKVTIEVSALQEYQDIFDVNEVKAAIDLSGASKGVGTYEVKVILPDNYALVQTVTAKVKVFKSASTVDETETETESTSKSSEVESDTVDETESETETENEV